MSRFTRITPSPDHGPIIVDIDIKPKDDRNRINLRSKGTVQVAVLTAVPFDADAVDVDTVLFAGAASVKSKLRDVDKDGDEDLLVWFKIQELNLNQDSITATLIGATYDGRSIEGADFVNIKGGRMISASCPLLERSWQ